MAKQTVSEVNGRVSRLDKAWRRRRALWLLAVVALVVAALAAAPAVAMSNRFYRFQAIPGWGALMCGIATAALLFYAPKLGWQRTWSWLVPAGVLTLVMVPLVPFVMLAKALGSDDDGSVVVAVSSDGRHDAVTHYVNAMIDTLCAVRVREHTGLFSRQTSVWTAPEGQRCPRSVSFTGADTISIIDARGREITAHFDADRMQRAQPLPPL